MPAAPFPDISPEASAVRAALVTGWDADELDRMLIEMSPLPGLDTAMKELHPFYQSLIPSLARVDGTRAEVKAERDRLLALPASSNE